MEHTASHLDVHPALRKSNDRLRSEHEPRPRPHGGAIADDAETLAARESAAARGYAVRMLLATLCWAVGGGILASAPQAPLMACAALAVAIGIALALSARRRLRASLVGIAVAHGAPAGRAEAQATAAIDRIDAASRT